MNSIQPVVTELLDSRYIVLISRPRCKSKEVCSCENSISAYKTTRCHNPEKHNDRRHENSKLILGLRVYFPPIEVSVTLAVFSLYRKCIVGQRKYIF
jgi:hypothetical protein